VNKSTFENNSVNTIDVEEFNENYVDSEILQFKNNVLPRG
jgi:hypothetical protein